MLPFLKEKANYVFFAEAIRLYRQNNGDHKPQSIIVHPLVMAEFKKELLAMRLVMVDKISWCGVEIRENADAVYPLIVGHDGKHDYL